MSAATLWLRMEPAISFPGLAFPAFSLTAAFLLFLLPNPELPSPHLFLHGCGVLSGLQHNTPAFGIFTMVEGFHGLLLRNDFGPGSNSWSREVRPLSDRHGRGLQEATCGRLWEALAVCGGLG